jgi:hypothetical protein
MILGKAYRQAVEVSVESGFFTKQTADKIIGRAYANMKALSSMISAVKPEALAPTSASAAAATPAEGKS